MAVDAGGIASSVRRELGSGLRGVVVCASDRGYDTVRAVLRRMHEHGVIASPIGTAFEMAPPLIASRADLDEAVRVAVLVARALTALATREAALRGPSTLLGKPDDA